MGINLVTEFLDKYEIDPASILIILADSLDPFQKKNSSSGAGIFQIDKAVEIK